MVEAKLLRKKLKNGLIVDKWDLVTIIEKQQAEIEALKKEAALQRLSDFTQEIEAKYGITTKWDGITTYHETTEPIGKAQEND